MEIFTILWREAIFFKRRFLRITVSAIVSPVLYLIAFGWGLGRDIVVEGHHYMFFIIPGIIALTTMNTSFNAVAIRINISRLHEKSFEYYLTAPVNMLFLTSGQVIAGALRGLYSACLIVAVSSFFGVFIPVSLSFFLICGLNCLLFASFGYFASMIINSHYEMTRFTSFIMSPMSFLCGTFFSLEKIPVQIKYLIEALPLTHAAKSLRALALQGELNFFSIMILFFYTVVFFLLGVLTSYREID